MTQGIKDKIVVVTGASSGLGEATARLLSAQGATVLLGARRADRLQLLAKDLESRGGKALALATDVTRREQVKALVDPMAYFKPVSTCGTWHKLPQAACSLGRSAFAKALADHGNPHSPPRSR